MKPISILDWKSLLPGNLSWEQIAQGECALTWDKAFLVSTGSIALENQALIDQLSEKHKSYKQLDRSTLLALNTVDKLTSIPKNTGVNIGSSRGATQLLEESVVSHYENKKLSTATSPNTTLGNISSWVGNHIANKGINLSHSITCSTGLHAVLNGISWINAGMVSSMLCGASEAPLTAFTIKQMQGLKIYSALKEKYPCQSMVWQKQQNTMVLGEAASVFVLGNSDYSSEFKITGVGWGAESINHPAHISANGTCMELSMKMALSQAKLEQVDALVMHAPGTIKGDVAEKNAIQKVFGKNLPSLTSNKWALGHTFAPSGLLNMDMALYMLKNNMWIHNPLIEKQTPEKLQTILVNAVGFGGNAVSVILEKK